MVAVVGVRGSAASAHVRIEARVSMRVTGVREVKCSSSLPREGAHPSSDPSPSGWGGCPAEVVSPMRVLQGVSLG